MVRMLLAAASVAAFAISPAPAADRHAIGIGIPPHHRADHRFGRHGGDEGAMVWSGYDLQSSYDASDWRADSGNDWWNDRPDRAYPRWVQDQRARGTCDPDRMWWSGSGWHC
jgi:hypothetical protein